MNKRLWIGLAMAALAGSVSARAAGVANGQPVNAAITNAAFLYKNGDDTSIYTYNLGALGLNTAPTSIFHIRKDQNSATQMIIDNQTSGTAAVSRIDIASNVASRALTLSRSSTATTGTLFGFSLANVSEIFDNSATTNGILFGTVPSSPIIFGTNNLERLRIDGSGNVGIGAAGSNLFDVTGTGATTASIRGVSSSTTINTNAPIFIQNTNSTAGNQAAITNRNSSNAVNAAIDFVNTNHNAAGTQTGFIKFSTSNSGTAAERMRIAADGTVTILSLVGPGNVQADSGGVLSILPPSTNLAWTAFTPSSSGSNQNFSTPSGAQTITFSGTGKYVLFLNMSSTHSAAYTASRLGWTLGGSATRSDTWLNGPLNDGVPNANQTWSIIAYGSFTNAQTITLQPFVVSTFASGTHTFTADYLLQYRN